MTIYVGTSGWQYRHWRNRFYPKGVAQKDWLPYYAERFQTVEVNNTFYNLPEASVFEKWRDETPDDFVFALKVSQYLTHRKRLRDPEEPVERFMKAARKLGDKLGPVLLQLPPRMKADAARLDAALHAFPRSVRVAVEFRDDSWYGDGVREVLAEHNAALCLPDRDEKTLSPEWRTADWGYIRFHGGRGEPGSAYRDRAMRAWAERIERVWREREDVFVYFNNDANGAALVDAGRLATMLAKRGLKVTRTAKPQGSDIRAA
jgi:uncharacterized protein YecE (DUF72 family)